MQIPEEAVHDIFMREPRDAFHATESGEGDEKI
jgi:hypothetical protein